MRTGADDEAVFEAMAGRLQSKMETSKLLHSAK